MTSTGTQDLSKKRCLPCEGGNVGPLTLQEATALLPQVHGWQLADRFLEREFVFKNFVEAIQFVNAVAQVAEEEGHHPDLHIHYNRVRAQLWTHAVSGLTQNDFILAAKINEIK